MNRRSNSVPVNMHHLRGNCIDPNDNDSKEQIPETIDELLCYNINNNDNNSKNKNTNKMSGMKRSLGDVTSNDHNDKSMQSKRPSATKKIKYTERKENS